MSHLLTHGTVCSVPPSGVPVHYGIALSHAAAGQQQVNQLTGAYIRFNEMASLQALLIQKDVHSKL